MKKVFAPLLKLKLKKWTVAVYCFPVAVYCFPVLPHIKHIKIDKSNLNSFATLRFSQEHMSKQHYFLGSTYHIIQSQRFDGDSFDNKSRFPISIMVPQGEC